MNGIPVRLKYATAQAFGISGMTWAYTHLRVKVKNLGFAKDVVLHFHDGLNWSDFPLTFLNNRGDYDVFGSVTPSPPFTSEFVLRYTVNGQVFWDNNNWQNYHLSNFTNTVGGNVALNRAFARIGHEGGGGIPVVTTSWVEGEIYVNNLSYHKRVGIRLSTNGGASWEDTDASFGGRVTEGTYASSEGVELWKFRTPEYNMNPSANVFQFAVYYGNLSTGEWSWDNNFGQDYKLSKADNSMID